MKYIYFAILAISAIVILFYISKTKNKIIKLILFFSSGLITMFLINLTTDMTGFYIPINYYTIGICSTLGISGNILILLLNVFLM